MQCIILLYDVMYYDMMPYKLVSWLRCHVLYNTTQYHSVLYNSMLCNYTLYHTLTYHTLTYQTRTYQTRPHHTMPRHEGVAVAPDGSAGDSPWRLLLLLIITRIITSNDNDNARATNRVSASPWSRGCGARSKAVLPGGWAVCRCFSFYSKGCFYVVRNVFI